MDCLAASGLWSGDDAPAMFVPGGDRGSLLIGLIFES